MPYANCSNGLISISDLYFLWKFVKDIKVLQFAISFITNTRCQCCGKAGSKDSYCTGMYIRRYKLPTENMKKTRPVKKQRDIGLINSENIITRLWCNECILYLRVIRLIMKKNKWKCQESETPMQIILIFTSPCQKIFDYDMN